MNLEPLKLRSSLFLGIADSKKWRFYLGQALLGYYCVFIKEPLTDVLYRFGLSQNKPIPDLKLDDLFDLKDLKA